jgi:hypothetical protein
LKALAQNTKTTFIKYRFLMIKHRLNTVKHRLLVEKDRGNACRKNQKKTSSFFGRIFLEVSVFTALTVIAMKCFAAHRMGGKQISVILSMTIA